ncbi:hypothetical protein [Mycobacterium sp.]|uniref:hypothetical protein n=1 Tax=Mycobacterium sp. TaxID=1785 RepID=UPI003340804E
MKFTMWNDAGESETVELDGPGGTIRVVVGEPGRQSGVWRIWATRNTSDVYIGVRAILGYQKWSLHESGDWRCQWISGERAVEFGRGGSRIIDQWSQPAEMGSGWTKGFSIRVRHQDLVEVADPAVVPADTLWIPPPPEGHLIALHVAIVRPDQGVANLKGFIPLGGFTLPDRRAVLLGVSKEPVTEENNQVIAAALNTTIRLAADSGVDLSSVEAVRGALSCVSPEGDRHVWDVAVIDQRPSG